MASAIALFFDLLYNNLMKKLLKTPIAHRGLHGGGIPENSLKAFEAAFRAGYAVETDVHFTKDKKVVIFHDDGLLRMTGVDRPVSDCTLKELRALRLGGTEERIPLLSELISLADENAAILLEIKYEPNANAKEFLAAVAEEMNGFKGEYAVQSFQPLYVRGYKKLRPEVSCGLLTQSNPSLRDFSPPFIKIKRHIVAHMSLNFYIKPDFLSFYLHAPSKKMQKFKGAKFAWTVRSEEDEAVARKHAGNIIFEGYLPKL